MPVLTHGWSLLALVAILAYLLGAVPFGLVIARLFGLGDIRQIGSGNIGATNVLRTGNKLAALLTLVLDAGKGMIAALIARVTLGEDAAQLAALVSFLGHIYPVYLGFKGGKGGATFLGTLLALSFPVGLAACATWLVVAFLTRYSSVAALVAAVTSAIWLMPFHEGRMILLIVALTVLIYIRHWANLMRLRAGTEPKIGKKKAA